MQAQYEELQDAKYDIEGCNNLGITAFVGSADDKSRTTHSGQVGWRNKGGSNPIPSDAGNKANTAQANAQINQATQELAVIGSSESFFAADDERLDLPRLSEKTMTQGSGIASRTFKNGAIRTTTIREVGDRDNRNSGSTGSTKGIIRVPSGPDHAKNIPISERGPAQEKEPVATGNRLQAGSDRNRKQPPNQIGSPSDEAVTVADVQTINQKIKEEGDISSLDNVAALQAIESAMSKMQSQDKKFLTLALNAIVVAAL